MYRNLSASHLLRNLVLSNAIISGIFSCTTELTYTELKTYMVKAR